MPQSSTLETLLFGELRKLSSLIKRVSVNGVFINITFTKLPSRNRDILLNGVADRLFRVLTSEYSFFRERESMWIFKKVI
jgi:hypothetical protein